MQTTDNQIVKVHDKYFKPFILKAEIAEKVAELGAAITEKYAGQNPLFISILNGAFVFAADLMRHIQTDCEITFVKLSSYKGTSTTGNVQTVLGLDTVLRGRHIVIVEDIIDTGTTMHNFLRALEAEAPASVAIATCFFKSEALRQPLSIDYVGFDIPNKFIIGYGLDYDGLARNLDAVYQLHE